jgi:hypothetical protein
LQFLEDLLTVGYPALEWAAKSTYRSVTVHTLDAFFMPCQRPAVALLMHCWCALDALLMHF